MSRPCCIVDFSLMQPEQAAELNQLGNRQSVVSGRNIDRCFEGGGDKVFHGVKSHGFHASTLHTASLSIDLIPA